MKTTDNNKVMNLPIFQHCDSNALAVQGKDALSKFRKGELPIFNGMRVITLALLGGVGYFTWVYVLPTVFMMAGALLATAAVGILAFATYLMLPAISKGLRRLARNAHKKVIGYDPFGELEEQKQEMINNLALSKKAKAEIVQRKEEMQNKSRLSEKIAEELQKDILLKHGKTVKLRAEIEQMKTNGGEEILTTDDYINKNMELMTVSSEATRQGHLMEQAQNFVRKYGTRAAIMQKVDQKLALFNTVSDIKIKDFEATIQILKEDSQFASTVRSATDAARSAIGFATGWERDYALDVVTNTIAKDLAATNVNLSDIDSIASNFDMDNDDMFAKLDILANEIKAGANVTPDSKQYQSPGYKPTADDKIHSGGFGSIFN